MSGNIQIQQELIVSPEKIKARQGDFQVILHNKGSLVNTYQLKAGDPGGLCSYSFNNETVTLEAGSTATITLTVKFKKAPFAGASKVCDFTITAIKAERESITAKGQLECPSRLPIWALAACGVVAIAIIVVVSVLANKGGSSTELLTNSHLTMTPTASATNTPLLTATTSTATTSTPKTTPVPTQTTTSFTSTTTTTPTTSIPTSTTNTTPTPSASATPTPPSTTATSSIPNISGTWDWHLTITVANGACAGEEGAESPRNIKITQNEKDVTMSGFLLSAPSTSLSGEITFDSASDKWIVKFSGSYAEDGGTTTSNYTLVLNNSFDVMTGEENWDWNGTCSGSKSTITATKVSGP